MYVYCVVCMCLRLSIVCLLCAYVFAFVRECLRFVCVCALLFIVLLSVALFSFLFLQKTKKNISANWNYLLKMDWIKSDLESEGSDVDVRIV